MLKRLFTKRKVPVTFLNYNEKIVDTTLFDQNNYYSLRKNGITISPINIIHSASIHYTGRFDNSMALRFINSFIDIIASVKNTTNNGDGLLFSDEESNEFQTKSSEVIAVGICITITSNLFNISRNTINLIEGSGKRCDFCFIKNSLQYYIESKGRKVDINPAIKDIFKKKSNYNSISPKYGVISHIPRDSSSTKVTIVDPDFIPEEINKNEKIKRLFLYYSKLSHMIGFWRLAELLRERYNKISEGFNYTDFNNKPLDYDNVVKLGRRISISTKDISFDVFMAKNSQHGFKKQVGEFTSLFLMEAKLLEILEQQYLDELLQYQINEQTILHNDKAFSIQNDGSVFAFLLTEDIDKHG